MPDCSFDHVHVDIVGPFPESNGFMYLLTCVDRFSRWQDAFPIQDITSETVAKTFVERWVAIFGVPSTIRTDRGKQFESALFTNLVTFLSTKRVRTTAYHHQANGLVERFQLKAALTAHGGPTKWAEALPLVLLGIRTAVKADSQCSAAEMVFGTPL